MTTDRSTLETIMKPTDKFFDCLLEKLGDLLTHSFISSEQSKFLRDMKSFLQPCLLVVLCDFAENYYFVIQDEIQSYHRTNVQTTIHTFVIYHNESSSDTVSIKNLVIISHCPKYDTTAVHLFQKYLMESLKQTSVIHHKNYVFLRWILCSV